ncbi:hypothetical protein C8Q76DRAFT_472643 [Earliella scabrosa]|nr:hypothetical protein C8Q76DRAFT_472643 [Earliella scabrosa]
MCVRSRTGRGGQCVLVTGPFLSWMCIMMELTLSVRAAVGIRIQCMPFRLPLCLVDTSTLVRRIRSARALEYRS